uniref:Pentraxin (PTX) domain-containing protein n=1 Tax=Astatotilapia calliptera TaxID=8154 RepID=A0A3P8NXK1_ASTCA
FGMIICAFRDPQSALQFHNSFTLTFTHWWRQATVVATAALGQTDRSEGAISRHRPLWPTPVGIGAQIGNLPITRRTICTTWDSESELVQLWLNGKPSIKKFIGGLVITDPVEQDSHGGGFDINQCFVGMMSDVRMWNYDLSPCEIQALEFEATGRVLVENKLTCE